jgi:2-oxoisovalerate dehydrogenase E2 component (dihydrolipoyl transacylase)
MSFSRMQMPPLGESVRVATVSKWLIKPGDRVTEFQPMLEVDTDKVSAEIPAPCTGTIQELLVSEGEAVAIGADIAVIALEVEGETPDVRAAPPAPAPAARDSGPAAKGEISPAVATLAKQNNLDLSAIPGSGLGGRVTKRDVLGVIESRGGGAAESAAPASPMASLTKLRPGDELIPLTRVRRMIVANVVQSKATIPHAWQSQEVDMSGVVRHRAAHKERFLEQEGFGLTYVPYVLAAASSALRANPILNSTYTDEGIIVHRSIDLGVAIGLENSVVVPAIRNADGLSIGGLARGLADLSNRARDGKLTADDLSGVTFTVNNSGTFGTLLSYSVINPGQAGILTMAAVVERPVAKNGMLGIAPLMYLCFSLDHRIVDGLGASRFLTACRVWLEAVGPSTPLY